ncbi:MAG: DUF885 family protein [Sphingomonas sp.]
MASRRDLLIGGAAVAATWPLPALARPTGVDTRVRAALDSLTALPTPEMKLARVEALSTQGLSHSTMLDLETARAGLTIDAKLAKLFPDTPPGQLPHPVGPNWGAWRKGDSTAIDADTAALRRAEERRIVLPQPFLDRTITALQAAAASATPQLAGALNRQAAALATLRSAAGSTPGVWQLPNGPAFYALLLERQLGEAIEPAAAHARLMAKWTQLANEADRLLVGQGFAKGTTGDRFRALFRDPRWHYPDTSAGRDRAVADMNAELGRARAHIAVTIGQVPPYCLDVSAKRMTPADEAAEKGGYRIVAAPGRPGVYFVDLADIRRRPSWSLASVVHHELLPGHMIQMPIDAAADPHPLRAAYTSAFTEGWAIYAEALAAGQGLLADDDRKRLGALHWALFRIGRAIADTGIHHARWSIEQALDRLYEVQGEPAYFAPFESDVDRICLDPGIRAAEALIWLRLEDLRRQAGGDKAGAAMRRFHQIVLADGRKRLTTIAAELGRAPA